MECDSEIGSVHGWMPIEVLRSCSAMRPLVSHEPRSQWVSKNGWLDWLKIGIMEAMEPSQQKMLNKALPSGKLT